MKKLTLVILLVAILFSFSSANAEKEPTWTYVSTDGITDVSISEDSGNISATYGKTVSLWLNHTSTPYNSKTLGQGITSMDMSSNGKYVVIAEESDATLTLYEQGTKEWDKSDFFLSVNGVDITSDGSHIAVIDYRNVYYFGKSSNEEIWSANFVDDVMSSVAISSNSQYLAAGTEDGNVYVYDTSSSDYVWYHSGTLDGQIIDLDFSEDSNHLIVGTENGKVYIFASLDGVIEMEYAQPDEVTCVSGSLNSNYYAFGTDQGLVSVLDLSLDFTIWEKDIGGEITEVDFNGKGSYLVAGSTNKKLLLANITNGDEIWRTTASGGITGVSMSYRGENILVGTSEGLELYYEQQLDNQAPITVIESINPTTALPGTLIAMNGSAFDSDGFIIDYLWNSNIDGNLSNLSNFTISNLTTGYHIITFKAEDNEGRWSRPVTANVGVGDFPEATIDSISGCTDFSNCIISEDISIDFTGSAVSEASNDTEVVGYQWVSNFSGIETIISESASFSTSSLQRGSHEIIFRAINDIGFWSSNVTANIMINGVPILNSVATDPNPVVAGSNVILIGDAEDPDGDSLQYLWTTDTLYFVNGLNTYESSDNGSSIVTLESDTGEYEIYLRVMDSYGALSESTMITIQVLSPPSVSAVCQEEVTLNEEILFNAIASDKPPGKVVKYEWDFDSSTGDIDSVDSTGSAFATHSYNSTPIDSDFLVVLRVTDDDGLTSRDTCTVTIIEETSTAEPKKSQPNSDGLGSISEIANGPVLIGILLIVIIGAGVGVYLWNKDNQNTGYVPPSKAEPISGSEYMDSVVPQVSPVKERRVKKRKVVTETMTIECPECSSRMDIPKISGTQQIKCSDCGLEGEIDL
ncbi:MAG: PKD domain-containing protein [archaeon]|nr:PKD domain-containing protein [archaeon]